MYAVVQRQDGSWYCEGRVQDGTEYFDCKDKADGVRRLIQFARISNGSYIKPSDVRIVPFEEQPARVLTAKEAKLLDNIASGRVKTLHFDDLRVKADITHEECELIIAVREGRAEIKWLESQRNLRKRKKP